MTTITVDSAVILIIVLSIKGLSGNKCTSKAAENNFQPVLSMCEATSGSSQRIVIDTYDSSTKGVNSCFCTAAITSTLSSDTLLNMGPLSYLQPGRKSGCGSNVVMSNGKETSIATCDLTGSHMEVKDGDVVSITWKINDKTTNSKYCALLYFSANSGFNMSITCTAAGSTVQTQAPTTIDLTTTRVAHTTTIADTTTIPRTTTVIQPTTQQQQTTETSTDQYQDTSQTPKPNASTTNDNDALPLEIVAPAAAGVVIVLIIVVVVAVICSRKSKNHTGIPIQEEKQSRESHNYDNSLQPYAAVNMALNQDDGDGDDGMKPNQLYVSADETMVTNRFNQNPNDMYAEVQKKPKSILKDGGRNFKSETTESTYSSPGPVYAVVNKNKHQGTREGNVPSRYLNEEGLVYTHVDVSEGHAPLPPPKQFSNTKPADDRVIYSEITTEL